MVLFLETVVSSILHISETQKLELRPLAWTPLSEGQTIKGMLRPEPTLFLSSPRSSAVRIDSIIGNPF